jgi:hypothetical protein
VLELDIVRFRAVVTQPPKPRARDIMKRVACRINFERRYESNDVEPALERGEGEYELGCRDVVAAEGASIVIWLRPREDADKGWE